MSCNTSTATDLKDFEFQDTEFGLTFPDFARPDLIHIDHERIAAVGTLMGSKTLRLVTEAGPVSERHFDTVLSNTDWMPRLGNTIGGRRNVPSVRVAAGDMSTGREIDWVILNTSEINDRFQESEHKAHSARGRFTTFVDIETVPIQITWSHLVNTALRHGLRELAAERRKLRSMNILDVLGVRVLTSGKAGLAHAHIELAAQEG